MEESLYRFLFLGIGILLVIIGIKSFYDNESQFRDFYSQIDYSNSNESIGSGRRWLDEDHESLALHNQKSIYTFTETSQYLVGLYLVSQPRLEGGQLIYEDTTYRMNEMNSLVELLDVSKDYEIVIDKVNFPIRTILITKED